MSYGVSGEINGGVENNLCGALSQRVTGVKKKKVKEENYRLIQAILNKSVVE